MSKKIKNVIEKAIIASLLLVIPLYQKFPLLKVPSTSVSIRAEDFLLGITAIYVIVAALPRVRSLLKGSVEQATILFIIAGLLSIVSAYYVTQTISPFIALLHWGRRVEYFIPLFFALTLDKTKIKDYLAYILKLITIAVIVAFVYGLGQKYLSWPIIVTQNTEYSKGIALRYLPGAHIPATFAGHYDMASYLVLVLPILVTAFFSVRSKISKLILFTPIVGGLWLLANSLSRTSVVCYLGAVFVALVMMRKFKLALIAVFASLLVFSFSSELLGRYSSIFRVIRENVQSMEILKVPTAHAIGVQATLPPVRRPSVLAAFEDRSTSIRLNVEWPRALRAFTKNPLFGTGYSSITLATDNDYLRLLGEVGALGFLAFLYLMTIFANYIFVFLKSKNLETIPRAYCAGFSAGFMAILVNSIFIDLFEASKFAITFWFLAGIFVIVVRSYEENKKVI